MSPTHTSISFDLPTIPCGLCVNTHTLIMELVELFLHDLVSDAHAQLWLLTKHPPGSSQIGLQPTNLHTVIFPPSVVTLRSMPVHFCLDTCLHLCYPHLSNLHI